MRFRDIIQFGKNVLGSLTFELDQQGWPKIILSGKGLFNLYENPILAQKAVSKGFIEHRALWENFEHELKFVEQSKHREVLTSSFSSLKDEIDNIIVEVRGTSGEEAWLTEVLQALSTKTQAALQRLRDVPEWEKYNEWNRSSDPAGEDELMTPEEETKDLLDVIRQFRLDTLWAWASLIDLLRNGPIKSEAQQKLGQSQASVGLDPAATDQPWVPRS
jgi:hypothetical protein